MRRRFLLPCITATISRGDRLWPVHNGVIWVFGQRPEAKGAGCEVGPGMAPQRSVGGRCASVEDRLFYAVRSAFVVFGNVCPDIENIRFGKRCKNIEAHRL